MSSGRQCKREIPRADAPKDSALIQRKTNQKESSFSTVRRIKTKEAIVFQSR
jgi:hypothetical protein